MIICFILIEIQRNKRLLAFNQFFFKENALNTTRQAQRLNPIVYK